MRKKIYESLIDERPTEKQMSYIGAIERRLSVLFTGTTKYDAMKFISCYKDKYKASFMVFENEVEEEDRRYEETRQQWIEKYAWWELDPFEEDLCPFGDGWGGGR